MPGNRWVIGLQCHPELEEESPKIFGNIFEAFVERAELISEKAKKS
jgi:gamma-glutamyl-gamma-aminobutyrate hydrolase PuuD